MVRSFGHLACYRSSALRIWQFAVAIFVNGRYGGLAAVMVHEGEQGEATRGGVHAVVEVLRSPW